MGSEVAAKWLEPWGDRRQEIVFIGSGLDEARIRRALDAALMPARDFTPQSWARLPDPFPSWKRQQAA
jgi:hypothetical protein